MSTQKRELRSVTPKGLVMDSAFQAAAFVGDRGAMQAIRMRTDRPFDVNYAGPEGDGDTALTILTVLEDHDNMRWLLEHGATPNVIESPSLWHAVSKLDVEGVRILLNGAKHQADPNPIKNAADPNLGGETLLPVVHHLLRALALKTAFCDPEAPLAILRLLKEHKADPQRKGKVRCLYEGIPAGEHPLLQSAPDVKCDLDSEHTAREHARLLDWNSSGPRRAMFEKILGFIDEWAKS